MAAGATLAVAGATGIARTLIYEWQRRAFEREPTAQVWNSAVTLGVAVALVLVARVL